MLEPIERRFRDAAPAADFVSLRLVEERSERVSVRQDIEEPLQTALELGAMITVIDGGGYGYAATSDLSASGLRSASARALEWARRSAERSVVDYAKVAMPSPSGEYESTVEVPWASVSLAERLNLCRDASRSLKVDDRVVDWEASLWYRRQQTSYVALDRGRFTQTQHLMAPNLTVTANEGAETHVRSLAFLGNCRQGGLEVLDAIGFGARGPQLGRQAIELLGAPNCPSGKMDLVLMPDQMMLQIHESIGHPIELDRILGDERNYAGTSFVTMDMFGSYQYGSEKLNVTYDPTRPEQFASYGFDDDGQRAEREFVIKDGVLVRPLGGVVSQARADVSGVANSRASSWNRPPIDRMANLNVEPGDKSLDEIVSGIERGVLMESNTSWSIDDSRNKFQFGCEIGWLIENGERKHVVKRPNYRGVSATFWRNLENVGSPETFEVYGTPYCGKGEPNQAIWVGHASPVCHFADVEVFGGEA
jgi:predicted Zn-dependent protease